MITAILAVAAAALVALGVSWYGKHRSGPAFTAAAWVFFGGLAVEDVLLVLYAVFGVGA